MTFSSLYQNREKIGVDSQLIVAQFQDGFSNESERCENVESITSMYNLSPRNEVTFLHNHVILKNCNYPLFADIIV